MERIGHGSDVKRTMPTASKETASESATLEATRATSSTLTGPTPSASRKLNFYFPASMIGYFDDLASALQRNSATEEEMARIAEAHGMEIVGPPSERYI
jgi:hypothetical protein